MLSTQKLFFYDGKGWVQKKNHEGNDWVFEFYKVLVNVTFSTSRLQQARLAQSRMSVAFIQLQVVVIAKAVHYIVEKMPHLRLAERYRRCARLTDMVRCGRICEQPPNNIQIDSWNTLVRPHLPRPVSKSGAECRCKQLRNCWPGNWRLVQHVNGNLCAP